MQAHYYNPDTMEYRGSGEVDIVPGHATAIEAPETSAHQVVVFVAGTWQLMADYRGTTWYKEDGTPYTITMIGVSPASTDSEAMPASVVAAQEAARATATLKARAQEALDKSDITVLRCLENAIAVPEIWRTYRDELRAIVAGTSEATELPAKPDYPAGT